MAKPGKRMGPPPSDSTRTKETRRRGPAKAEEEEDTHKWVREAIESIAIAIMLAFLFRAFEAEAFVIPTGSMAPTLYGRHKDIECPQCGYHYATGASENAEFSRSGPVATTTCPMCRYTLVLDLKPEGNQLVMADPAEASFTGDRILVNKFAYQFGDPQRWDVIVFKFPGNAKQNFIKRLIGLPGEVVRIHHGDIFTRPNDEESTEADFRIATRSPRKLLAMLQKVHDTDYIPAALIKANWPAAWEDVSSGSANWQSDDGGRTFHVKAEGEESAWLRYRHRPPSAEDWMAIEAGTAPPGAERPGELISDFYAYNAFKLYRLATRNQSGQILPTGPPICEQGMHWVGDLAVECDLTVESDSGKIALDLVEAGRHHTCTIDLEDGTAVMTIDGGAYPLEVFTWEEFENLPADERVTEVAGPTSVKGAGSYALRFANVDDELTLWVDDEPVLSTHYARPLPGEDQPRWSIDDPGDLLPAGVAAQGATVQVNRLAIFRDLYYIAAITDGTQTDYKLTTLPPPDDGWKPPILEDDDYTARSDLNRCDIIRYTFSNPSTWANSVLWNARRNLDVKVGEDHFFPMGDNCPQSEDGRFWFPHRRGPGLPDFEWPEGYAEYTVPRELLTGKAFMIYWPHPHSIPLPGGYSLPIVPNVGRMGLVR